MRKLLLGLFVLLLVLVGGIAVLLMSIDGERFRPTLIAMARDQAGLELGIDGTLELAIWPDIALEVTGLDARWSHAPQPEPLLQAGTVRFRARLLPLLSLDPRLEIAEIELSDTRIDLRVDESGRDNWSPPESDAVEQETAETGSAMAFSIARIDVRNASASYVDARSGERFAVEDLRLALTEAGADDLVPLQLSGRARAESVGSLTFDASTRTRLAERMPLKDLDASIDIDAESLPAPLALRITGDVDLAPEAISLQDLAVSVGAQRLTLDGRIDLTTAEPGLDLSMSLADADPRPLLTRLQALPVFADPTALQRLGASARITSAPGRYRLTDLALRLDDTNLNGTLDFEHGSQPPRFGFQLQGDRLNLDRYATGEQAATPGGPMVSEDPLPLDGLDDIAWNGRIGLAEVASGDLTLSGLSLQTENAGRRLSADFGIERILGGRMQAELDLDRSRGEPALAIALDASDLAAAEVAPGAGFIGPIDVGGRLSSAGTSTAALARGLTGALELDGDTGTLDVSALKAGLLTVGRILGHGERVSSWPDRLQYQRLSGRLQFVGGTPEQALLLSVDNLVLDAEGGVDLAAERFDYRVGASFRATDPRTFDVHPDMLDVRWPLRCRGALGAEGNPCGMDAESARVIATQIMTNRALDPVREQIEDKLPEPAKQLLRGLFGQPPRED